MKTETWNKCLSCEHSRKREFSSGTIAVFCAKTRNKAAMKQCFGYRKNREKSAEHYNCPKWCPLENHGEVRVWRA